MNIIHHVHSKPEHVRHWVAIGCTAVVGLVVLGFWFHSFQSTTYALLNPGQETTQDSAVATSSDSDSNSGSLFGSVASIFSDMKAQIGNLFNGSTSVQSNTQAEPAGPAHPLPVAGDK